MTTSDYEKCRRKTGQPGFPQDLQDVADLGPPLCIWAPSRVNLAELFFRRESPRQFVQFSIAKSG